MSHDLCHPQFLPHLNSNSFSHGIKKHTNSIQMVLISMKDKFYLVHKSAYTPIGHDMVPRKHLVYEPKYGIIERKNIGKNKLRSYLNKCFRYRYESY